MNLISIQLSQPYKNYLGKPAIITTDEDQNLQIHNRNLF